MLEQLSFEIGGMCGIYNLSIQNTAEMIEYKFRFPLEEEWYSGEIRKAKVEWLEQLDSVSIKSWRSTFTPFVMVCDGVMWSLEYKEIGKRWRHIRGDNCYPSNWNQFLAVLNALDPKLDLSSYCISETDTFELIPFTYGELKRKMQLEYVDYPDRLFGQPIVTITPVDFFNCTMDAIHNLGEHNMVDRNQLYDILTAFGYNEGCLEDVEWCIPEKYRDFKLLRRKYQR